MAVLVVPLVAAVMLLSGVLAPGTNAYAAVTFSGSEATATIAVNDFANYRVFQRDIGGVSKSVTISGTYADMNWNRVEARVLTHGTDTPVVDWLTIDSTPDGGTFSGDLTVPQGGWYNIEVRALDGAGAVLGTSRGTNKWGVGMLILVIGQSNMSGRGQPPFTIATSDLAVNYSNGGRWEHLADPYDDESPPGAVDEDVSAGGSTIPGIANSLLQTFDLPIAFVPSAKGGSNLYSQWSYRNPSNHYDTTTLYGQSITKAQQAGGVELIIMHQGEADLSDGRTEANYEADFATMIGHYRQDLYSDIPIFICQLGTVGSGTDARATGIRNAQHDVDNGTSIFMGATAMELPRIDTWHYTTPALTVIGSRLANAIKYYYGQSTHYRGPSINSAFFSDTNRNQVIVTLNHHGGTDITPATGITGFAVFDNGSGVTIGSAVRYSSNAVLLILSRSIAAGHTATLRYLYGMTPTVSGLVKDNSPLALPLENTTADITVASTFPVSASVIGTGGTILPESQEVSAGGSATVTLSADPSFYLAGLTDNTTDVTSQVIANEYTILNVDRAHVVVASFSTYPTLRYTAGTGGTISGVSPQTVNYGANGTAVAAVPNLGYHFVNWSDGVLTATRQETNVTANLSVTANFALNTFTLTYSVGTGGTISGTTPQTVNYGASGTAVTAVATTGYHFVQWSDGSTANPRTDTNVTANISVTANFALNIYTLAYSAGTGGTISGTSPQTVNHGASGTAVTAVATTGYHFVQWSDGVLTATRQEIDVTADKTVNAQFVIKTYTLTYATGMGGTISGATSQTLKGDLPEIDFATLARSGSPVALMCVGDSTANGTSEWFYRWLGWLAPYLADSTLSYRLWDDVGQAYGDLAYIQKGTNGLRYATIGATPNRWPRTLSDSDYNTTDLDFRLLFRADDYTPSASSILAGRAASDPDRQWWAQLTSSGLLALSWCPTGSLSSQITEYSTDHLNNFVDDGDPIGLRITLDADNGSGHYEVKFYWSDDDGVSWTQFGSTKTGGSTTALPGVGAMLAFAGTQTTAGLDADYYRFELLNEIGGYPVAAGDLSMWKDGDADFNDVCGRVWTFYTAGAPQGGGSPAVLVLNASVSGVSTSYFDEVQLAALSPDLPVLLVCTNLGHNVEVASWPGAYETMLGHISAIYGGVDYFVQIQNPEGSSDGSHATWHSVRMAALRAWVISKGYRYADCFSAFEAYGEGWETDLLADGRHPNADGSQLWADTAAAAFGASGTAVTAVPSTGYHFVQWSDGSTANPRTDTNVTATITVTASFALNTYTLTYTAGTGGTISGTTPQTVNHGANGTAVTAVPNLNYHFVQWSDGVLTATRTDTNVTADITVTAQFAADTHTLTYSAGTGGTISGTTPQTVNYGASGTAVTAVPNTGYHFVQWSDGVTTATREDANVTADISVTASFAINTYTLTYAAGTGGTITGTSPQTVAPGGSGTPVTAVSLLGYHFVQWSDGVLTATRQDTNVLADVTVTANFAVNAIVYTSIRGSHRYHTAQLVSQAMFAGALPPGGGVVVAPGETFQEALCGAPLAAAYGGPVLLTPTVGLENGTKAELQRLAPTYVFVIGLSSTIATAVQTALPAATVVSINGANIYEMSRNVANALESKVGDMTGATAIITIGTNFADAIGAAPLAAAKLWPIILTDTPTNAALHVSAAGALTDLGITKALKVGTYVTLPGTVTGLANLSGADRYVTNTNVAAWAKANAGLSFMHIGIATGDKFPDALASGPYLAKDDGILLLSPLAGPLPPSAGALLTANALAVQHVSFIAMIEPVISQVKALLP